MRRLSGKIVRDHVLERIKKKMQELALKGDRVPGLAVILVGSDPASETYVRNKREMCLSLGFVHFDYRFDEDASQDELLDLIDRLNEDDRVDGILVQLPLPKGFDENMVINRINPDKDVDGFSPANVGRLSQGQDCFIPCTPYGIMEILSFYGIETDGKRVAVVGRSNIVGKPMAMLLMSKGVDATVTVCNTHTKDLRPITMESDIVIVATGRPGTLDASMVKDGTTIIDVGMNRIEDSTKEKGFRLVGDCDYPSFKDRDVSITPVPGGVGLMTVMMLMVNTFKAYERRMGR